MNDEFLEIHKRARVQCRVDAMASVTNMALPKVVVLSSDSFSGLGRKTCRVAAKELELMIDAYGDKLPYLIGLALRQTWFSLFDGSRYIALMMAEGAMGNNDYMQKFATAEGYGEIEGIAWSLYNHLSELASSLEQATFREGTPFDERVPLDDVLKAAALYWFEAAANAHRAGDVEATLDWLSEAHHALSLANGNFMWDEAVKTERETAIENSASAVTAARTTLAKAAAQARHSETRSMKADVFKWLDAEMPSFKSMDAAAQAITKQQPIAFRTARDWVGDWKKLRSTGKP
jgi:hypothetical protein